MINTIAMIYTNGFLINLIESECKGGIVIIPLNFISSIRKSDIELRKKFLSIFTILLLNIFEEQVFDDTSYAVCSILFEKKVSRYIYINLQ
jgi:hypothetical protein